MPKKTDVVHQTRFEKKNVVRQDRVVIEPTGLARKDQSTKAKHTGKGRNKGQGVRGGGRYFKNDHTRTKKE